VSQLPNDARFIATFPNSFHFIQSDDYASQTRRYAFANSYRLVEGRAYNRSDAGRPIVDCIYISGFASNGQYYTGLTDKREPAEQRSATQRPSVDDSTRRADLSALPQATLSTHVDSIRSMPTSYGLVSTSQNWYRRRTGWYRLAPTNTNATKSGDLVFVRTKKCERFYEFCSRPDSRCYQKGVP
jgi:hypothetical protein